ncbi:MAG: hypothetical protein JJU45_04030 [Acidimicrobiia bacterium]|nr:hypothetical protein [Acidimicrobiia bacterium]
MSPEDIEAKFRELAEDVDAVGEGARSAAVTVGAVVVVAVVVVAFWLGRRRGRKAGTVVEIRRV